VGLLAGCVGGIGSSDGGGNGSGDGTSLTIGYQPFYAQAWSALLIKNGDLAENYLPDGSSIDQWQSALQGSVVGQRMNSDKNQVGYMGDMPTITTIAGGGGGTPISAVGLAGYSRGQQCNLAIAPKDSDVSSAEDLAGKTLALTTGTCTHRFFLNVEEQRGVDFGVQDTDINTILANIRQGSIPAGFGWEPNMSKAVIQEDVAEYVLTGAPYEVNDAAGIAMTDSLLEDNRETAKAMMKAELEAKHIMATDEEKTLDLVSQESDLSDYDREVLRACIYENVELNPEVKRLEFVTDYSKIDGAATLLQETGPQFLKDQGALESVPESNRYKPEIVGEAASELSGNVDWEPLNRSNSSSSTGNTSAGSNDSSSGSNVTSGSTTGSNSTV
jgi:ABC-type nitrate/sulfonate/bicarbonate transport system substrate-binding protein